MLYGILAAVSLAALWISVRYIGLRKAIRNSDRELQEITEDLEQNRIVKMSVPCRELEGLLITVNEALEGIRRQKVAYEDREAKLQRQIENISHDLRTPLTAIIGYLDLINTETLGEDDAQSFETVRKRAGMLQRLVSQFYDLARLEAGDYNLDMQEADIGKMLREELLDSFGDMEQKGIQVEVEIPERPVMICCDQDAMGRIFLNLIQNAGRYAASTLKVAVDVHDKITMISFENDVKEMKHEEANRLFDRFYTADPARGQGGTGLGLTISRHLTESMGGIMDVMLSEEDGRAWLKIVSCDCSLRDQ